MSAVHELDELIDAPARLAADVLEDGLPGGGEVRTAFQPIVELQSGAVVGFEALTRGPAGTALEAPMRLFEAVEQVGARDRFDRACRDASLASAIRAELLPPLSVFVNVEPALVEGQLGDDVDSTWRRAPEDLRCVIEVTERALTARPAELLHAIAEIRDLSWGVALDDVGVDPRSIALMSLLRPDVIKLDRSVIQAVPGREIAQIASAVAAQAERTGAVVVAEGVETEEHEHAAITLGATLAQGYRYGRPGPLPTPLPRPGSPIVFIDHGLQQGGPTPYQRTNQLQAGRRGSMKMLTAMIDHLAGQAAGQGTDAVVLALRLPDVGVLDGVADSASLVGLLADEPQRVATDGELRVAVLDPGEALGREIALVVLAPHFAAAITARAIGDDPDDPAAPVDLCSVYDRDTVVECAHTLAARLPRRD